MLIPINAPEKWITVIGFFAKPCFAADMANSVVDSVATSL